MTNKVFRPPSEAKSLIIRLTEGCHHNKCTFCGMYRSTPFRMKSYQEIEEEIHDACRNNTQSSTVFLADGNSIILPTQMLIRIICLLYSLLPGLSRVTIYGSPQYIVQKSKEDLENLKKAGLSRIHSGMESGDDQVLLRIKKGATAKDILEAGKRVKEAGLELHLYVIIGIGGKELSHQHASSSAELLNRINPDAIHLRTFYPLGNAPIYRMWKDGTFRLLRPYEVLAELELFVRELNVTSMLLSDHVSNYVYLRGELPEDKERFLSIISGASRKSEDKLYPFFFGRKIVDKC